MVSAYAPHLGEELWEQLGHGESVSKSPWPDYDEALTAESEVTIVVQINGKVRDKFTAPPGMSGDIMKQRALSLEGVTKWLKDHRVIKVITVPDKLVNLVVNQD
jgi:leucyl-tRNA synthetase